jgi:hypothetical protein
VNTCLLFFSNNFSSCRLYASLQRSSRQTGQHSRPQQTTGPSSADSVGAHNRGTSTGSFGCQAILQVKPSYSGSQLYYIKTIKFTCTDTYKCALFNVNMFYKLLNMLLNNKLFNVVFVLVCVSAICILTLNSIFLCINL